ncbi:snRNA-activating protein complex subunit-like [Panicum virgatum]|uniref:snRNA-activating protein complex subunit n=1 Tax=Panicum virgatum TaxID=38727 RepID=A0A8T0ST85_PANVG|nr:snRNA-activating protein complex subunit-like [Panicum virgatum]KAG2602822.1 hypothetical protein PVAP13_5KG710400 [Panicum virgatum]
MAAAGEGGESSAAGERQSVSFARGGPLFVPFMVGPISNASGFMHSALQELQSLEDELGDPGNEFDDELCVDELRVLSEEELVERALQEAMEEDLDSGAPPQPEEQTFDEGMSANPTPRNETLASSPLAERENSRLPGEDTAAISGEPESTNGKLRGKKAKTRSRKGKTGTITLDSSVERESQGSPSDMAIVPYEPEGSEGNGTTTSDPSARNGISESLVDGLSIVPLDLEGINGQTACEKGKKRGRHFDREVRAKILQGSYLTKADKWVEIKAKQDEDKFATRLHSFSGDSMKSKGSKTSSEKIEMATSLKLVGAPWKNKSLRSDEHRPVVHPEVILCVEIYQKKYGSVKSQELLVLGSQFLTDLRDNICCLTDKLMNVAGQHDHSGYFLIEDTFYNDMRHRSATDYSKPILDWLQNSSDEAAEKWDAITSGVLKKRQKDLLRGLNISNVPEFKSERMQTTRFSDLQFRPGAGYLYCHQGSCKHTIVIRDMRLIHQEDSQNQADYPLQTFQLQKRLQKCSVCQIYPATKMTVDDKWALNNPCYFCIKCYYLLHYKEDNTLLYQHTVYDFIQE